MPQRIAPFCSCLIVYLLAAGASAPAGAQRNAPIPLEAVTVSLPDAPQPQGEVLTAGGAVGSSSQEAAQASPSAQSAPPEARGKSQREAAEDQIKQQEHQRVLGIVPQFNTSYRSDAVSLTGPQKINLAFHSAVDPFTFAGAVLIAGYNEADDNDSGFGWGADGFGKRVGAAYLDSFDGTMLGNGIFPALLHQDPRYFRLGHGSASHRILYAAAATVMCRHDNSHRWEPNYSNIGGNLAAGAISNLYYPSEDSGIGQTFENGLVVTAEGAIGGMFQEFWPDISRKLFHKDPTNGQDALMRAQDAQKKQKKQPLPPAPK